MKRLEKAIVESSGKARPKRQSLCEHHGKARPKRQSLREHHGKARPKRQSLRDHHVKPDVRGKAFVNTMDKPGLSSWGGPTWGQLEANLG